MSLLSQIELENDAAAYDGRPAVPAFGELVNQADGRKF